MALELRVTTLDLYLELVGWTDLSEIAGLRLESADCGPESGTAGCSDTILGLAVADDQTGFPGVEENLSFGSRTDVRGLKWGHCWRCCTQLDVVDMRVGEQRDSAAGTDILPELGMELAGSVSIVGSNHRLEHRMCFGLGGWRRRSVWCHLDCRKLAGGMLMAWWERRDCLSARSYGQHYTLLRS